MQNFFLYQEWMKRNVTCDNETIKVEEGIYTTEKPVSNREIRPQPYLTVDFNNTVLTNQLYQQAIFIERATLRDNFVYIHYDANQMADQGRTLIITADSQMIRTKTLPQTLMENFRSQKEKKSWMLKLFNIHSDCENRPFICGHAAYIPIQQNHKKYQGWLAIYWVDDFVKLQNPRSLVQVECLCAISLTLRIRYQRFYKALYLGFVVWKLQRAAFKTMYPIYAGYHEIPMLNFPHFYMHLLFRQGADDILNLNEELKNLGQEIKFEIKEKWLEANFDRYF